MTRGFTIDEVKPKLLSLDTVRQKLSTTEPFESVKFPVDGSIRFQLNDGWNHALDGLPGTSPVDAYVDVKDKGEYQLTVDSIQEAASLCGLPKGYISRTPANLIEPHLNYWFREGKAGKEFQLLTTQGKYASAVIRGTLVPFSNLRILENVLDTIEVTYGQGEVLADYKFEHTLQNTHLRLIIPEKTRVIENTGVDNDTWSIGLQISNSLTGLGQTSLDGYLFRYWCTNGAVDTKDAGVWSRKAKEQGQDPENVYGWVEYTSQEILAGLESSLDHVQRLTDMTIENESALVGILNDLYDHYRVPGKIQNVIDNTLLWEDNLTMYAVMQAITQAANETEVNFKRKNQLMSIGGELLYQAHDRCNSCSRLLS
jgi:hypothetical protein